MKRIAASLAILAMLYIFYACGGGGGTSTPAAAPQPQVPRAPQFVNISTANLAIYTQWSSINGANYYQLYYSNHSSLPLKNNGDVVKLIVFKSYTTVITSLPDRYYLTVTAVNNVGESTESKRREAVTTNPTPPPPPLP
ncbi:MAG: hypothetical protein OHK0040_01980 [bacterium]